MLARERELQQGLFDLEPFVDTKFKNIFSRREVPIGEIVPDIVYISIDSLPDNSIWPNNFSYKHAFVLWLLRNYSRLTINSIARKSYESLQQIEPLLEQLVKTKAISKIGRKTYSLSQELRSIEVEVVAVEVKLKDWSKAISQAQRYNQFANRVAVVMPAEEISEAPKILKEFQETGIGLWSVDQDFRATLLVEPELKARHSPETEYLIASVGKKRSQMLWRRL